MKTKLVLMTMLLMPLFSEATTVVNDVVIGEESATAIALNSFQNFPQTWSGENRYIIFLPKEADEHLMKVEVAAGRIEMGDTCNQMFIGGAALIEVKPAAGNLYFRAKIDGDLYENQTACPSSERKLRFVIGGRQMLPYSSNYPIIVIGSSRLVVKTRIWKTGGMYE